MRFQDRHDAGRRLAAWLEGYRDAPDKLVLGIPRGGVVVAYEVARALNAPLEPFVVRKVGVPGQEELAMGAVTAGGGVVRNETVLRSLGIGGDVFDQLAKHERREAERRAERYRGGNERLELRGRTVLLVDDGLATGATMTTAVQFAFQEDAEKTVVAVPVAARITANRLRTLVNEVVCIEETDELDGIGAWYENFRQTTDEEVQRLMAEARARKNSA